jgi:DNA-binding NtrC family response regulator
MDQDCGGLQLVVFDGDAMTVHPLPREGRITLGRDARCDILLSNPSVSRRHAALDLGPPLRLQDLGGVNGTFVRHPEPSDKRKTHKLQQVLKQAVEINVGDCIGLGSVMLVIRNALSGAAKGPQNGIPSATLQHGESIVRDPAMRGIYEQAFLAAEKDVTILLLGETGVGKEVLASIIHRRSLRREHLLVPINCAAIPEPLLESELFGHEKGAYSGATERHEGLFEAADGGTVFLDEIGELPPSIQVKLLRVLEDRKVRRVGGLTERRVDVRFIAATNRDLEADVARGAFRQDLFFRLNVMTFTIPPLRERISEIAPLSEAFAASLCHQYGRLEAPRISPDALSLMERYPWPGNVRELRNVIERAIVLCLGDEVLPEHLPPKMASQVFSNGNGRSRVSSPRSPEPTLERSPEPRIEPLKQLQSQMKVQERQRIVDALATCGGHQGRAAKLLGISRRALSDKLDAHRIARPRKGSAPRKEA